MLNNMKWKNPGITFISGGGGSGGSTGWPSGGWPSGGSGGSTTTTTPTETPVFTSNMEQLAGQTFPTQEALDAAEGAINTQTTITANQTQSDAIAADPNAALTQGQANIANWESQIANLTTQVGEDPGLQAEIDRLAGLIQGEQTKVTQAQRLSSVATGSAQRDMAANAISNPSALIEQAQVETTQVTPDQLIAAGTGDAGAAAQAGVSTVQDTATAQTPARQEATTYDAATINDQVQNVTDDLQAATAQASDKATVRGQLAMLMEDFEGGETPPWASGPMRQAMQMMQSRGMGASSIAGAAVVQAAMESAISIASQDANINAQFEMKNLDNAQQTTIFKTQQRLAGLFSDQAAVNASAQFNATSENQTNQFFSNLEQQSSQFNANQINAIRQFNSGQTNAVSQFNTQMRNQRDQFNAQNSLVISQANAQWRQSIATTATATQNMANMEYTKNANAITGAALDQLWQRERDLMDYAFTSSESSLDRANALVVQRLAISASAEAAKIIQKANEDATKGAFWGEVFTSIAGI